MPPVNSVTHSEYDVSLRLVEVWFDSTWAYLMSSHTSQIAKRVDKRRRHLSSTASSISTTSQASHMDLASVQGKSLTDKLETLHNNLKEVRSRISYMDFKDLCDCCLKGSDQLYPGFRDVTLITHYLLKGQQTYKGLLTDEEIDRITLPMIYQCIYYQLCDYLLQTSRGAEGMKLLCTPTKITNAAYDICRQKFCRLLCDEVEIIQYGIFRLIRKVRKHREKRAMVSGSDKSVGPDQDVPTETPVEESEPKAPEVKDIKTESSADVQTEEEAEEKLEEEREESVHTAHPTTTEASSPTETTGIRTDNAVAVDAIPGEEGHIDDDDDDADLISTSFSIRSSTSSLTASESSRVSAKGSEQRQRPLSSFFYSPYGMSSMSSSKPPMPRVPAPSLLNDDDSVSSLEDDHDLA